MFPPRRLPRATDPQTLTTHTSFLPAVGTRRHPHRSPLAPTTRFALAGLVAMGQVGCTPRPISTTDASSSTGVRAASSAPLACALPEKSASETAVEGTGPANVLGTALAICGTAPRTGFRRDGRCETGPEDKGVHVACAQVTSEFLSFTAGRGNDLSTPSGQFPGLKPGDRWCLCAARWAEAEAAGVAPPLVLEATHAAMARVTPKATLQRYAVTK